MSNKLAFPNIPIRFDHAESLYAFSQRCPITYSARSAENGGSIYAICILRLALFAALSPPFRFSLVFSFVEKLHQPDRLQDLRLSGQLPEPERSKLQNPEPRSTSTSNDSQHQIFATLIQIDGPHKAIAREQPSPSIQGSAATFMPNLQIRFQLVLGLKGTKFRSGRAMRNNRQCV